MITRFAPSPTGLLHVGHVANAIFVWGIARAHGGTVVLRLEDHDRGRFRLPYEHAILRDLEWLGLEPDVGAIDSFRDGPSPLRQSDCFDDYERIVRALRQRELVYSCRCTRADVSARSRAAPGQEAVYSGRCREQGLADARGRGLRVKLPDVVVDFHDVRLGPQSQNPQRQCGDMLIRDREGNWTYQFCVAVDDWRQNINMVIRGEDLLASTGRQLALRSLLGANVPVGFFHHPLIRDADGRKLSKRDGDRGLDAMRAAGMSREDVIGRAAFLVGLTAVEKPMSPGELATLFR